MVCRELTSLCRRSFNIAFISCVPVSRVFLASVFRSWNFLRLSSLTVSTADCPTFTLNRHFIMPKEAYYAVAKGRTTGIFRTWDECKAQVGKFTGARYKKFPDSGSAAAFIAEHQSTVGKSTKPSAAATTGSSNKTDNFDNKHIFTFHKQCSTAIPMAPNPDWRPGLKVLRNPRPISANASSAGFSNDGFLSTAIPSVQVQPSRPITTSAPNSKRHMKVTEDRVVGAKRRKVDGEYNSGVDLTQFTVDEEGYVIVYTDGACTGNGKKGAAAGIGVWFGDDHSLNISEPVKRGRQTNNVAEIQAAERAISQAKNAGIDKLNIKTDSQFTINCITKWVNGWIKNNWKLKSGELVKNKEDLEKLISVSKNVLIKWSYVAGHKGEYGNEQADQLAVRGARS